MKYLEIIEGKLTDLRLVEITDAEFILSLRLDENLNRFVNKVSPDIIKQREWIRSQQVKENDYYFIIQDKANNSLGTISLYNIENETGEFGRWVSIGNALQNLESVILLHKFGFNVLNLKLIHSNTVVENKKVLGFHKNFGANVTEIVTIQPGSGLNLKRAEIRKEDFEAISIRNYKLINLINGS